MNFEFWKDISNGIGNIGREISEALREGREVVSDAMRDLTPSFVVTEQGDDGVSRIVGLVGCIQRADLAGVDPGPGRLLDRQVAVQGGVAPHGANEVSKSVAPVPKTSPLSAARWYTAK